MPRTARKLVGGTCYHVLNRGNDRQQVIRKDDDFANFIDLMAAATGRVPLRILGYVLMPNHFHLVVWPNGDQDLSRWMQWLLTSHGRRYQLRYHGSGHIWQGRFKAIPIQQDEHLWKVLRYVERNPLRAGLIDPAEAWPWSSLHWRSGGRRPEMLADWPVPCPHDWLAIVNSPENDAEFEALRKCIAREVAYGGIAGVTARD